MKASYRAPIMTPEEVAHQVRSEFEQRRVNKNLLQGLYLQYAPRIPDVESFLLVTEKLFPKLSSGIATLYLQHLLGSGEIITGKHKTHHHTFLKLADGRILDITADQYGRPKVYCGPLAPPNSTLD